MKVRGRMTQWYILSLALHGVVLISLPGDTLDIRRGEVTGESRARSSDRSGQPTHWPALRVVDLVFPEETSPPQPIPEPEEALDIEELMERLRSERSVSPLGATLGAEPGMASGEGDSSAYAPPVPLAFRWPEYPEGAPKSKDPRTVVVKVHVTAAGIVDQAVLERPLESDILNRKALEVARGLRFRPAMLAGRRVSAWFRFPVTFNP